MRKRQRTGVQLIVTLAAERSPVLHGHGVALILAERAARNDVRRVRRVRAAEKTLAAVHCEDDARKHRRL